jgi:TPP-dependent pyruvate/acetoin dehydrogenase alpha subunit
MDITKEQKIKLYTNMVRVRKLDELIAKAFYDKKLVGPFFHSQQGQEAIGVGANTYLRPDDYLFYTHRGHGLCEVISKGLPAKNFVSEHFGKVTGSCKGVGFFNNCDPKLGFYGLDGTVGGEFTMGAGAGLAAKMRGKGQVVAIFLGDGATGRGTLHEAMLMCANWKLPVIWLCSNNGMGMWVPVGVAFPKENIADLAFGYGIPSAVVDGQDVLAVYESVQTAVARARAGEGPSFIEFKTCRFNAQLEGAPDISQEGLRSEEEVSAWKQRDPVKLFREKLLNEGVLSQADADRIDREALAEAEEAEKFATESPVPTPDILEKLLYAD